MKILDCLEQLSTCNSFISSAFPASSFQNQSLVKMEAGTYSYCTEWNAHTEKSDLLIENFQFQVFPFQENEEEKQISTFGQLGYNCTQGKDTIEVIFDPFKVSLPVFLLYLSIMLGTAAVIGGVIYGFQKLFPEFFKKCRKVVFKV